MRFLRVEKAKQSIVFSSLFSICDMHVPTDNIFILLLHRIDPNSPEEDNNSEWGWIGLE